jgi:hypothetical protein
MGILEFPYTERREKLICVIPAHTMMMILATFRSGLMPKNALCTKTAARVIPRSTQEAPIRVFV